MNETLLHKVLSCSKLPTLPAVALRVIELTSDDNVTMRQLAEVIENDQGLAMKILKTVNSSFYGLPRQCSTLTHAQALLGLNAIKTLALGFTLVSSLQEEGESCFDYESYWRRSIYTAVASKAVASMVRIGDAEEAFLGGLLQDIGMIALYRALGEDYCDLVRSCGEDHHALVKAELHELELQHPDIGAMLAERWRLPTTLVTPIKYHERPTAAPMQCRDAVRAVALGGVIADVVMRKERAYWMTQCYQRANQWFSLSPTQTDEIIERVLTNAHDMARLFAIDLGTNTSAGDIVEIASERLAGIALEENRKAMEAACENAEIRRALNTDALTGLGTRGSFMERAGEQFEQAREEGSPLSVVLLDVDHFRTVNDELGSEVGDVVLVRIAQRLKEILEAQGVEPYRYGGEEFGVAFVGVDRLDATRLADHIRQSLGSSPLDVEASVEGRPQSVQVTMSVGVATLDAHTERTFTRVGRLIHAADQAVYAAKEAGGDCVRVFTPSQRKAA